MEQETNACRPELSIVIPAYNAEKHIVRTLTTLTNQTANMEKYQIILVDDGSTDDTLRLSTQFAKQYSNINIIHKENGGVSSARNAGVAVATGRWLSFVDSDDYVDSSYVDAIVETCPDADYVIFDNFLEQDEKLTKEKKWLKQFVEKQIETNTVLEWVCDNRINAPWDKRFCTDLVKKHGIQYLNGINRGEDLLFNTEYVLHAKSAFVSSRAVYIHTDNADGLCHQQVTEVRLREYEAIYNAMIMLCKKYALPEIYWKHIHTALLRNITNYAGQLYRVGFAKKDIAHLFNESRPVQQVMFEKMVSNKDKLRKLLLKFHLYSICSWLFR